MLVFLDDSRSFNQHPVKKLILNTFFTDLLDRYSLQNISTGNKKSALLKRIIFYQNSLKISLRRGIQTEISKGIFFVNKLRLK